MNEPPNIDYLGTLTPDQLGKLLLDEIRKDFPDIQHIQGLIYAGCPIDTRDIWGCTALQYASCYRHLEIVKLLISNGALDIIENGGLCAWDISFLKSRRIIRA